MSARIDKKMQKIAEKQAELQRMLAELEAQKKLATLNLDHPDIKKLMALVEDTAEKLKTTPKKILTVLSGKTVSKPRESKPAVIKYRDTAPGCDNNTWSGRGLMPLWLKRYEAAGRSRTEFLIP
jgi:DNA-binding protein H-NS